MYERDLSQTKWFPNVTTHRTWSISITTYDLIMLICDSFVFYNGPVVNLKPACQKVDIGSVLNLEK